MFFVNLLNSGAEIEHTVSGIVFSFSMAFVLIEALVARLVVSAILFLTFVVFLLRAGLVTNSEAPRQCF